MFFTLDITSSVKKLGSMDPILTLSIPSTFSISSRRVINETFPAKSTPYDAV